MTTNPDKGDRLPCAHCGNDGIIAHTAGGISVVCEDPCCAPTDWETAEEAIEKWNRRAAAPPSPPVVTDDSVVLAEIRLAWAKFRANEYSVIANMDFVKALEAALSNRRAGGDG